MKPTRGILTCSETGCSSPTAFIMCCQFAGDHPYCEKHAKLEPTFMDNTNSHYVWMSLEQYQENEIKYEKRQKKEAEEYKKAVDKRLEKFQEGLRQISFTYGISKEAVEKIANEYNNLRRTL